MNKLSLFIKKSSKSYWIRSSFFALIGRSSNTLFGFISFLILVRTLSPADFGTWSLYVSVCTFLELWKSGFIGNPLIRYASGEKGIVYSQVVSTSFGINIVASIVQMLFLIIFAFTLSQLWDANVLKELFFIFIISTFFLLFQSHYTYLQQANLNFEGGFWSNLTRQSSIFIFLFIMFLLDKEYTLIDLAWVQSIGVFFSTIVAYSLGRKYDVYSAKIHKKWLPELLHFGKYSFGTNLSSTILRNIDSWMLGYLVSTHAVGLYNPALRLSNLFELPTTTLTSISFPKLVQRIKDEGAPAAKYLYEKSLGLMMSILVPLVIGVIIFAKPIILILAGENYLESINILRITMLYGLIIPFNRQVGITLTALGKPKTAFLFVLRNTIINIILNYIFITYWGLIGAALATLITFLFALVYNQYYINKLLNVKLTRIFGFMLYFYKLGFQKLINIFN